MSSDRDPGAELATVHRLPVPAGEAEIVDAELVEEYERLSTQRGQALARRDGYIRDVRTVARGVRVVATHHRTQRIGKALLRYLLDIGLGHAVILQQLARHATHAAFREQVTAASAAGDMDALMLWQDRLRAAQDHRSRVLHDLPQTIKHLALGAVVLVVVLVGVLVVVGVALTAGVGASWRQYWDVLVIVWRVALVVVAVAAGLAPVWWLWNARRLGKAHRAPVAVFAERWVDGDEGREILPTADGVLDALRYLGVPALDRAFKRGWGTAASVARIFRKSLYQDGKGYACEIILPKGVDVESIVRRKSVLAANLVRGQREVWITEPSPAVLGLWIADPGALSGPIGDWPLLTKLDTATTDYWKGIPCGVNLRGDVITGHLFQKNHAYGGVMGSGKSSLAIVELAGALLDPLVDAEVYVCAENGDYLPFEPRLDKLMAGIGPATIDAAIDALTRAYQSLEYRGAALKRYDEDKLTRAMAAADARLRPKIIIIDECQRLFLDEARGEQAQDVAVQLLNAARKYGITLILLTPEPTGDSLPRKMMSVISNKAVFSIGDQVGNDAVLGTGSYKQGISAVGLEPATDEGPGDVGTAMQRGFTAKPGLLRAYFLTRAQRAAVTERAMELRAQFGVVPEGQERDLLDDVDEVLDARPMARATDVCAGLRRLAPGYAPYKKLTAETLRDQLAVLGASVKLLDGVLTVRASVVTAALTMRDADED